MKFGYATTNNATTNECYKEQFLSIKTECYNENGDGCSTVVKMLCYKSEGRCFDSRWCHWNFSLT